jgi:mono/diheme cytochrome c family protein
MTRILVLCSLPLFVLLVMAQEKPGPSPKASGPYFSVPVESARAENPVKPTPESLARGKKQYGYDCTMCHGANGDGKGEVATDMKLKMNDETNPALLKEHSDGELFYIIKKGKDRMPPEGDRVKDETIWDMVNYVRSFTKPAPADKPAEEKAAN